MPSHYPVGRDGYPRKKTWKGRVMIKGKHYFVGYYTTREEAAIMEDEFRAGYQGCRNQWSNAAK